MNRKQVLAAVIGVGAVTTGAAAQDAVQWRVEDGGNGHWYRVSPPQPNMTWSQALNIATSAGGHPVTFGSGAETAFVVSIVQSSAATLCPLGPWIGLVQDTSSPSYSEPAGGWRWVDGSESPINWQTPISPNNDCFGIAENHANMTFDGRVNDLAADPTCIGFWPNGAINSVIIEWSADCNADGVVDYGQILSGELEDTNSNGVPDCCDAGTSCNCPADIDGNGDVNGIDLAIILDKWGTNGGKDYPNADIDGDGTIAGADLAEVLGNWGACQ
jgi:hypothetical protein